KISPRRPSAPIRLRRGFRSDRLSSGIRQAHILEANLAARDKPPVLASKAHLPELLGRTLMNGFGHEGQTTPHDRAQEIRVVVDANCELATIDDREGRADAGRALDCRGERPSMDDSPGRVMIRPDVDRADDAVRPDRFESHAQCLQEGTRAIELWQARLARASHQSLRGAPGATH